MLYGAIFRSCFSVGLAGNISADAVGQERSRFVHYGLGERDFLRSERPYS